MRTTTALLGSALPHALLLLAAAGCARTAPAPSAAAVSPAPASATSGCAGASYLLCEDFERGALDPGTWRVDRMADKKHGTVEVSDARAARGRHALHLRIEPGDLHVTTARITQNKTFPLPGNRNSFYVRMFMWMKDRSPSRQIAFVEALQPQPFLKYMAGSRFHKPSINYCCFNGEKVDVSLVDEAVPFPVNRWVCLEYHFDGENEAVTTWYDGKLVPGASVKAWKAPRFAETSFGLEQYGDDQRQPYEAWIDEIAIDVQRIGCGG